MTRYKSRRDKKKIDTCLSREIAGCTFPINQNAVRRFFAFAHTLTGDVISQLRLFFCALIAHMWSSGVVRGTQQSYPCVVIDFEPLDVWNTRVCNTHIYIYVCIYAAVWPICFTLRLLLPSASELLHLVFYAASNSNVSHHDRDLDLLSFSFPLFVTHASLVAQTILYQSKARSPRIYHRKPLYQAFVNPCCCQSLSHLVGNREALCSPSPIALFINNSLVDLALFSLFLFISLFFSVSFLYLFLFILFVLLEEKTHLSRVYLSRERTKRFHRSNI